MRKAFLLVLILVVVGLLAACGPSASSAKQQQIAAGKNVYSANCARCHSLDLEGQVGTGGVYGPPLNQNSMGTFGDAQALFEYLQRLMPLDFPGMLSEQEYYQVEAYILDFRGLFTGSEALSPQTAANVKLRLPIGQ